MAKSIEQEQGRQPAGNLWTNIGASAVNTINAATQELENLSPRAKGITRRVFLLGTAGAVVGGALWEYQRRNSVAYMKELRAVMGAAGVTDAKIIDEGELTPLIEGKMESVMTRGGRRVYLVNFSRFDIRFDKKVISQMAPPVENPYTSDGIMFFNRVPVPDSVPMATRKAFYTQKFQQASREQQITGKGTVGLQVQDVEGTIDNLRARGLNVDLTNLSPYEKTALGVRLGIHLSVVAILRMRYVKTFEQLESDSPRPPDLQLQQKEREINSQGDLLFERFVRGAERPIFQVVFR